MNVIEPINVTDAILTNSNIVEDDEAPWDAATTYAIGDQVLVVATHCVYQAVVETVGEDPSDPANIFNVDTNPTGNWLKVGASNRWKAFDQVVSDQVENAETITYSIEVTSRIDSIALFNLSGSTVRAVVNDPNGDPVDNIVDWYQYFTWDPTAPTGAILSDTTVQVSDTSEITDWYQYFTWDPVAKEEVLLTDIVAPLGSAITITIAAPGGTARVGQIVMGRARNLGTTLVDTEIGFRDFSRKDRDTFGNTIIVERAFSQTVDFQFVVNVGAEARVRSILANLRATPSTYYSDVESFERGALVYGFFEDFSIPLAANGVSFATLEVESLT